MSWSWLSTARDQVIMRSVLVSISWQVLQSYQSKQSCRQLETMEPGGARTVTEEWLQAEGLADTHIQKTLSNNYCPSLSCSCPCISCVRNQDCHRRTASGWRTGRCRRHLVTTIEPLYPAAVPVSVVGGARTVIEERL